MVSKIEKVESNTTKGKGLFNIGEQRKQWLKEVSGAADCYENEVVCMLIDQAAVEDPENFATRMRKFQTRKKIEDIERREKAMKDEKEALVKSMEDHEGEKWRNAKTVER